MTWRSSRGETEIFVLVIVILGAFLLAGGQLLFQSNADSGLSQPSAGGNSSAPTPTPTAGATLPDWRIEQINGKSSCDSANQSSKTEIAFHGTQAGFYELEVKNGTTYQPVPINGAIFNPFTPGTQLLQVVDLDLHNSDGFNTKPWRVLLFQGGTVTGNDLTGATQKAETDPDLAATGC